MLFTPSRRTALLTSAVLASSGGLIACGSDDKTTSTGAPAPKAPRSPATTTTAKQTIDAWFRASRGGDAKAKCTLESLAYKSEQYPTARDEGCLKDAANNQPQFVWAKKIRFSMLEELNDEATAVVQPNASSDARATVKLQKFQGIWRISSFQ